MARPKGTFKLKADEKTLDQLRGLGQIQATYFECGCVLGVTEKTFAAFLKREPEAEWALQQGKGVGCVSLKREQWNYAKKSAAMLIWLGKQYLGQTDHANLDVGIGISADMARILKAIDGKSRLFGENAIERKRPNGANGAANGAAPLALEPPVLDN